MTHADLPAYVALDFQRRSADDMRRRAREFLGEVAGRRSVRHFSDEPVPIEVIEDQVFDSLKAAEWAVFKRRWERLTGRALDID